MRIRNQLYNKKQGFILVLLCLFSLCESLYAQTDSLEVLWDEALNIDYNLKITKNSKAQAEIENNYKWANHIPSLSVSSSSNFENSLSNSMNLGMTLPGDLNLGSSFSYSMNKLSDYSDGDVFQNIGLGFSLSSGTRPYWLQGEKRDPVKESLRNNLQIQTVAYEAQSVSLLINVSSALIELRAAERQIFYLKEYINYNEELLFANREMYKKGLISMEKIWEIEEDLWDSELSLLSEEENLISKKIIIREATSCLIDDGRGIQLPSKEIYSAYYKNIAGEGNLEMRQVLLKQNTLFYNSVLRKQNYAPSISLGYNLSWDLPVVDSDDFSVAWQSDNDYDWSLSLTVSLTPLFLSGSRKAKALENQDQILLNEEIIYKKKQIENEIEMLKLNLERLRKQKRRTAISTENAKALYRDSQQMYKDGLISAMDLEKAHLELFRREKLFNDICDQLWYQELLLEWTRI